MDMEPGEATPDLVGRTSARLLAAGVDRRARLDALRLLAILDASADAEGRVRRPLDDLAGEFELEPLAVLEGLDHLEDADAISRVGGMLVVANDGANLGGLQLADFLDDVQASFERAEPVTGAARRRTRVTRAGAAVLAAAAAVTVLTLAPSPTPTVVQPLAASSTTVAPAADTTTSTAAEAEARTTTSAADTPVVGTEPAPTTMAPPVDTSVVAAIACPTAAPIAQLVDDVVRITNPSDQDVEITSVAVGGLTFTVPFTVPAGGFVDRPVVASITDAGAAITGWQWTDPEVARTCPS